MDTISSTQDNGDQTEKLEWKDFFGSSVSLAHSLLPMLECKAWTVTDIDLDESTPQTGAATDSQDCLNSTPTTYSTSLNVTLTTPRFGTASNSLSSSNTFSRDQVSSSRDQVSSSRDQVSSQKNLDLQSSHPTSSPVCLNTFNKTQQTKSVCDNGRTGYLSPPACNGRGGVIDPSSLAFSDGDARKRPLSIRSTCSNFSSTSAQHQRKKIASCDEPRSFAEHRSCNSETSNEMISNSNNCNRDIQANRHIITENLQKLNGLGNYKSVDSIDTVSINNFTSSNSELDNEILGDVSPGTNECFEENFNNLSGGGSKDDVSGWSRLRDRPVSGDREGETGGLRNLERSMSGEGAAYRVDRVLVELIETERSYVSDLGDIVHLRMERVNIAGAESAKTSHRTAALYRVTTFSPNGTKYIQGDRYLLLEIADVFDLTSFSLNDFKDLLYYKNVLKYYYRQTKTLLTQTQGYKSFLKDQNQAVSGHDLDQLFGNVEQIYDFNCKFLQELDRCAGDAVEVCNCFNSNYLGFSIYSDYCTNYPRSMETLSRLLRSERTSELLHRQQSLLSHSLPLGAFLLKPVQRILKYHVLLQSMLHNYDQSWEGYEVMESAVRTMLNVALRINEVKRRHDRSLRTHELRSLLSNLAASDLAKFGELLLEDKMEIVGAKAFRYLLLFRSALIVAKRREAETYQVKATLHASNIMLVETVQKMPLSFHLMAYDNPCLQFTVVARNFNQKRIWCQEIRKVILDNYEAVIPEKSRQLVLELGESIHQPLDDRLSDVTPKRHQNYFSDLWSKTKTRRRSSSSVAGLFRNDSMENTLTKGDSKYSSRTYCRSSHVPNSSSHSVLSVNGSAMKRTDRLSLDNLLTSVNDSDESHQSRLPSVDIGREGDRRSRGLRMPRSLTSHWGRADSGAELGHSSSRTRRSPTRDVTCSPTRDITCSPVRDVAYSPVRDGTGNPMRDVTCSPLRGVTCDTGSVPSDNMRTKQNHFIETEIDTRIACNHRNTNNILLDKVQISQSELEIPSMSCSLSELDRQDSVDNGHSDETWQGVVMRHPVNNQLTRVARVTDDSETGSDQGSTRSAGRMSLKSRIKAKFERSPSVSVDTELSRFDTRGRERGKMEMLSRNNKPSRSLLPHSMRRSISMKDSMSKVVNTGRTLSSAKPVRSGSYHGDALHAVGSPVDGEENNRSIKSPVESFKNALRQWTGRLAGRRSRSSDVREESCGKLVNNTTKTENKCSNREFPEENNSNVTPSNKMSAEENTNDKVEIGLDNYYRPMDNPDTISQNKHLPNVACVLSDHDKPINPEQNNDITPAEENPVKMRRHRRKKSKQNCRQSLISECKCKFDRELNVNICDVHRISLHADQFDSGVTNGNLNLPEANDISADKRRYSLRLVCANGFNLEDVGFSDQQTKQTFLNKTSGQQNCDEMRDLVSVVNGNGCKIQVEICDVDCDVKLGMISLDNYLDGQYVPYIDESDVDE